MTEWIPVITVAMVAGTCFAWGWCIGRMHGFIKAQRAYSWALSFKAIGNEHTLVAPAKPGLPKDGRYIGVAMEGVKRGDVVEIWTVKKKLEE